MLTLFRIGLMSHFTSSSRIILAVSTVLALSTPGLGVVNATPAFADTADILSEPKAHSAKRTNGRDRSASSEDTGEVVNSAGSNGRNRGGSTDDRTAAAEADAPIPLQYAPEVGSSRVAGSNGRGRSNKSVIADELPEFDIAETAPEALENPAPNTRAAQMARYRDARQALFVAASAQEIAYQTYIALRDMTPSAISVEFPNGDHGFALGQARDAFMILRADVEVKQAATQGILSEMSAGVPLSDAAIRELNGLLGV